MRTRLGARRVQHGLTQEVVARLTGIALSTYRRLERGQISEPNLRHLVNCSIVLNCTLEEVLEAEWLQWWPFDQMWAPEPPDEATWQRVAAHQRFVASRKDLDQGERDGKPLPNTRRHGH